MLTLLVVDKRDTDEIYCADKKYAFTFGPCLLSRFNALLEFRDKRSTTGDAQERAVWLAEMELKRLETWMPTAKQMRRGEDFDVKL